ncbi:lipase family protein [Amycolatopsis minnesotensis]|uniref:Fungal lipase-type domain-containing protein n=1 Tax=Amycolatopsis minnesotensis TaxID=337894 RepID=A0ABP5BDR0_9PSEU
MTSPSLPDKISFWVSLYANLAAEREGTRDGLESYLHDEITSYLERNREQLGSWRVVWGPSVKLSPLQPIVTNAMYLAQSQEDPSRYVVGIAGTNPPDTVAWIFQNFNILPQIGFVRGVQAPERWQVKVSPGAATGLNVLKKLTAGGDRPGVGSTLRDFLKDLPKDGVSITVGGHSLGGTLASVFGLWLRNTQKTTLVPALLPGWDIQENAAISVLSTGGPTPGNAGFAEYLGERLDAVTRYSNSLDVVPNSWEPPSMQAAARYYDEHGVPNPVPGLFHAAAAWSWAAGRYRHIAPDALSFKGSFSHDHAGKWGTQVRYQHQDAYAEFFDIDGLDIPEGFLTEGNETIWTPELKAVLERNGVEAPADLAEVSADSGPPVLVVLDQPVQAPDELDSPEAGELARWIEAELNDSGGAQG